MQRLFHQNHNSQPQCHVFKKKKLHFKLLVCSVVPPSQWKQQFSGVCCDRGLFWRLETKMSVFFFTLWLVFFVPNIDRTKWENSNSGVRRTKNKKKIQSVSSFTVFNVTFEVWDSLSAVTVCILWRTIMLFNFTIIKLLQLNGWNKKKDICPIFFSALPFTYRYVIYTRCWKEVFFLHLRLKIPCQCQACVCCCYTFRSEQDFLLSYSGMIINLD